MMKLNNVKKCPLLHSPLLAVVLLMSAGSVSSAWGQCQAVSGWGRPPMYGSLPFPSNIVTGQDALGVNLTPVTPGGNYTHIECTNQPESIVQGMVNAPEQVGTQYGFTQFKTNVEGVLVNIQWNQGVTQFPVNRTLSPGSYSFGSGDTTSPQLNARLQLDPAKPVGPGVHIVDFSGWKAQFWTEGGSKLMTEVTFDPVSITVTGQSCDLNTTALNIPLDRISPRDVANGESRVVGRGAIEYSNCTGKVSPFVDIYATNISPDGYTLYLNSGSTAEGVGIQILRSNTSSALSFKEITLSNQATRDLMGSRTTQGGSGSLPFDVRYVKTGDVKGGTVSATAAFRIYYQ
ncbi:TPA: fimbrial protein [Kluyvera georgiana]